MISIYDLSWSATSFPAKLQLFRESRKREQERIRSNEPQARAQGYSALSSTYYSITGSAYAQLKSRIRLSWLAPLQLFAWTCSWLPLALWCHSRSLVLSNRVVELVGYAGMSADECDVRQSILRSHRRYAEAEICITVALAKNPEKAHTRGLLHVGLADIYLHTGNRDGSKAELRAAMVEAGRAEREDPRQAVRIYRHCADLADTFDPIQGISLRERAKKLAEATGAHDQYLKIN